jgi:hypothetical protein
MQDDKRETRVGDYIATRESSVRCQVHGEVGGSGVNLGSEGKRGLSYFHVAFGHSMTAVWAH